MWSTERNRYLMCTRCPTPCQSCRSGGIGPYCEETPCDCACHAQSHQYEGRLKADAAPELRADYARGRADALRDAVAALRGHLHAKHSMFNLAIEKLESLR